MTSDFSAKKPAARRTHCPLYYIFEEGRKETVFICQADYIKGMSTIDR